MALSLLLALWDASVCSNFHWFCDGQWIMKILFGVSLCILQFLWITGCWERITFYLHKTFPWWGFLKVYQNEQFSLLNGYLGSLCLIFHGEKMETICDDHDLWKRLMLCSCSEVSVALPVVSVEKSLNSQCPSSHRGVKVRRSCMFSPRCTAQSITLHAHIKSIE